MGEVGRAVNPSSRLSGFESLLLHVNKQERQVVVLAIAQVVIAGCALALVLIDVQKYLALIGALMVVAYWTLVPMLKLRRKLAKQRQERNE